MPMRHQYADDLNLAVGDAVGKCDAAKQKCVGKYVAAVGGCWAKAAGKLPGDVDSVCTGKAATKLADGVKGCLDKAAANLDCTNAGSQAAVLKSAADAFLEEQACLLDPANPAPACVPDPTPTVTSTPGRLCGNGVNDPGEACDAVDGTSTPGRLRPDFTCTGSCNCACPTRSPSPATPTTPGERARHRLARASRTARRSSRTAT